MLSDHSFDESVDGFLGHARAFWSRVAATARTQINIHFALTGWPESWICCLFLKCHNQGTGGPWGPCRVGGANQVQGPCSAWDRPPEGWPRPPGIPMDAGVVPIWDWIGIAVGRKGPIWEWDWSGRDILVGPKAAWVRGQGLFLAGVCVCVCFLHR